jgi:outer membrane protein assembly factor BamB
VFWSAHGLHAVAPADGKLLWKHSWETFCPVSGDPLNTGTPIFVPPDRIFISSGSGAALLRVTREVQWKARGFGRGSLIAADGKLFVLGESGNLAIVRASPDGFVEKAEAEVLSGKSWTAPSLSGGRLYLRNHDELVCLDLRG